MKKFLSVFICCVITVLTLLPVTVFAWGTPSLDLNISYNERKKEITVEYRVNDFAGVESADFRLRYDPDVVEFDDYTVTKMDNTYVEVGEMTEEKGKIAIQFVDLYHVEEADCEEDGSATVATLTFKVTDKSSTETVFIATADSCAMDPDSENIALSRYTEKLSLTGSEQTSDSAFSSSDSAALTKVIVAAAIALIVLVGGTAAIVIRYRKK